MTKNTIELVILVTDKGTKVIKKFATGTKDAGKILLSSFGGAAGIFGKMRAGAQKADAAIKGISDQMQAAKAAFSTAQAVVELAKMGAMSERVERRFEAFSEEAGGATKILEAFQRGAGGTVDKMGAMSTASRLLQMGLVGNAGEMEKVVEIATRLGDQTQGATDRISDFSLLLANQSIPRLDNFGISSGKVRARIAELQDQMPGLSRETAFMTATMEEAEKSLTKLGPRVDDDAAKFERLEAKMADTKVQIGQQLAPAIAGLFSVFSELLEIVSPLINIIGGLGGVLDDLLAPVGGLLGPLPEIASNLVDIGKAVKSAKTIEKLGKAANIAEGTISEWNATATEMLSGGGDLSEVMSVLGGRVGAVSEAFEKGGIIADIFVDQTGLIAESVEEANTIIAQNVTTWDEYRSAVEAWNATATDANAQIILVSESAFNLERMMQMQREEMEMAAESMAIMSEKTAEAAATNTIAEGRAEALAQVQRNVGESMRGVAEAQERLKEASIVEEQQMAARALSSANAAAREFESALQSAAAASGAAAAALAEQNAIVLAGAVAQTELAARMKDATKEQIAQALIGQLDPEALGAEGFTAAVTGIQLSFGLADEKSIALAANIGGLADAINAGIVPAEKSAEALQTMISETEKAVVESDTLIQSIEGLTPPLEIATQNATDFGVETSVMGERMEEVDGLLTNAAGSALDFGSDAVTATSNVQALEQATGDLASELLTLTSQPHVITIEIQTTGNIPQMQAGGIVPGPIGEPIPIIAHGGETVIPVGASSQTTNNFLTVNTTQAPSIPLEFQTMSAFANA